MHQWQNPNIGKALHISSNIGADVAVASSMLPR
jgi:hypothetical protein